MHFILIALGLIIFFLVVINWLAKLAPEHVVPTMALAIGAFLVVLGAFLSFTGRLAFGIPALLASLAAFRKYQQFRAGRQGGDGPSPAAGQMNRDEAYEVLGLKPGASRDEVQIAYKKLMQKLHPDKEGSEYLAQKINQARDTLIGKK